jgi:GTP pyrophosphokinase
VHAANCSNVEQLLLNPERRIPVAWGQAKGSTQPVRIKLEIEDRRGLLAEITSRISDAETNIRHIDSRIEAGRGRINLIVDLADVDHFKRITGLLAKIPGVLAVSRVGLR